MNIKTNPRAQGADCFIPLFLVTAWVIQRRKSPTAGPRGASASRPGRRIAVGCVVAWGTVLQRTLRAMKGYQQVILATEDRETLSMLRNLLNEEIERGVTHTAELLQLLIDYKLEDVIYAHQEALVGAFTPESIPVFEREIFLNAKFSEDDLHAYVSFVSMHGHDVLTHLKERGGLRDTRKRLLDETEGKRGNLHSKFAGYLKIFAGGVLSAGDITVGFMLPILSAANALSILGSVTAGIVIIADGIDTLGEGVRDCCPEA